MNHWRRLVYAMILSGVLIAVFILVTAIFASDVMVASLEQPYWAVVVLVLSYLLAPMVGRYIKQY